MSEGGNVQGGNVRFPYLSLPPAQRSVARVVLFSAVSVCD